MKRNLMFVLLLGCSPLVQAQTVQPGATEVQDPTAVPSLVKENFAKEQPGDIGTWSKEGNNYRVEYVDKESRLGHVIVFDRDGTVVRRDSELESVPGPINDYYQKNYPGETFRTWSAEEEKGEKYYYSNRQSETLRFDREGKLLSPKQGAERSPAKKKKGAEGHR